MTCAFFCIYPSYLSNPCIYGILGVRRYGCLKKGAVSFVFGVRGRCWLEMLHKIYYKWYIPFVCERFEKFLIFSINVVMTCDFSSIEICRTVGVRNKGLWMTEKWYSFVSSWSWRSIYGLNCIIRCIRSLLHHLCVSETIFCRVLCFIWDSLMNKVMD